jgi:hypothetical protein
MGLEREGLEREVGGIGEGELGREGEKGLFFV